jgi:protease PrsW
LFSSLLSVEGMVQLFYSRLVDPESIKLLALSIAPGLAISIYVYWKDRFEKEPLHLLVKCYILGCLAILPAIGLNRILREFTPAPVDWAEIMIFAFFVVSLSEEFCKFLVLRFFAYPKKDFNEPYDGITYTVMIAMGFATTENLLYIFSQDSFSESVRVGMIRMFTAVPAHATMAIMMGYFAGKAKFSNIPGRLLFKGFLAAFIFHGVYDTFLCINSIPFMTAGALFALYFSIQVSMRAIILHGENSPFRRPLQYLPLKKIKSLIQPIYFARQRPNNP